ncbi:MAG TPA: choice-of-anchor J domain-containing protein, partial [Ignavibacteria bacterium]|nr:choice-of-anchor J domain-containing protein [Ignavibacteria bacterium]
MKILVIIYTILIAVYPSVYSQHLLFQSNFETIPLVFPDSLPAGWKKLDVDQNNPLMGWAVNDTTQHFGGDTTVFKPQAHSGKKCLFIFWRAGLGNNNLNDDWVWTDSLHILTGDSLIFWCLLGSTPRIAPYPDSVQIHVCTSQNPGSSIQKLATIKSNDSSGIPLNNNTWVEHKFNLSQYAGQKIYIAWRYYMVINNSSGLWINIDDIMIGNRFPIGIIKINENFPSSFGLLQNYPNPFNPKTKI